jgi:hypothetical protein
MAVLPVAIERFAGPCPFLSRCGASSSPNLLPAEARENPPCLLLDRSLVEQALGREAAATGPFPPRDHSLDQPPIAATAQRVREVMFFSDWRSAAERARSGDVVISDPPYLGGFDAYTATRFSRAGRISSGPIAPAASTAEATRGSEYVNSLLTPRVRFCRPALIANWCPPT